MLNSITYGRIDATTEKEAGDVKQIPRQGEYRKNLQAKGFTDDEIVALGSLDAFGEVWDPKKRDSSKYPKLDNYYYKQLLTGDAKIVHQREFTTDADLKSLVDKFAQDEKAYHAAFSSAFIKLSLLGHESDALNHVETLLNDHPYKFFIDQYY